MRFANAGGARVNWSRRFGASVLRELLNARLLDTDAGQQATVDEVIAAGAEPCFV